MRKGLFFMWMAGLFALLANAKNIITHISLIGIFTVTFIVISGFGMLALYKHARREDGS